MNEIDSVAALATKAESKVSIVVVEQNGVAVQVLAVPNGEGGFDVQSIEGHIEPHLRHPVRRKGTAKLGDLASFTAHANRFKSEHSAIFADRSAPSLTSVLDYHEKTDKGAPAFGEHRGVYSFPVSDEWKAWSTANKSAMTQQGFAEFIENRLLDVADPAEVVGEGAKAFADKLGCSFATSAKLLELSRGLSIKVGLAVKNTQNLGSGEAQISFIETHENEQGQPLRVPGAFVIAIPVFKSGAIYQLPVRLRYRSKEGTISWFFELYRTDLTFDHAFKEACDTAAKDTGLPVFVGSPE
jgi:uncharacterized protein YfdQ (DUF2303 family)